MQPAGSLFEHIVETVTAKFELSLSYLKKMSLCTVTAIYNLLIKRKKGKHILIML